MKKLKKIHLTMNDLTEVNALSKLELCSLRGGGVYFQRGCGCRNCSAVC